MFCNNCGKEINETMKFCPDCGTAQTSVPNDEWTYHKRTGGKRTQRGNYNVMSIAGLVVSCVALLLFDLYGLTGLAGTILSIIGLVNCKRNDEDGKAFAIIGIVLGGIAILSGVVSLLFLLGIYNGTFVDAFIRMIDDFNSKI